MKEVESSLLGCLVYMFFWLGGAALLALWTQYNINQWLIYAGKSPACEYWHAFLASLLLPFGFAFNVLSHIVRLFV